MRKLLILLLLFSMASPPLAAHNCGTGSDPHSLHGDLQMSHTMGEQQADSGKSGPGCCKTPAKQESGCDNMPDCGNCYLSTPLLSAFHKHSPAWKPVRPPTTDSSAIIPRFDYPPYRPPIS